MFTTKVSSGSFGNYNIVCMVSALANGVAMNTFRRWGHAGNARSTGSGETSCSASIQKSIQVNSCKVVCSRRALASAVCPDGSLGYSSSSGQISRLESECNERCLQHSRLPGKDESLENRHCSRIPNVDHTTSTTMSISAHHDRMKLIVSSLVIGTTAFPHHGIDARS
jgi:hypothetical protein